MIPHTFTWMPLPHLPQVPDHFVKRAFDIARPISGPDENILIDNHIYTNDYKHRQVTWQGQQWESRCQEGFDMGEDWKQWVRENIFEQSDEILLRLSVGTSPTHGAHCDNPGKIRLYYLLDRGGEDATTVFYWKPGGPFVYDVDSEYRDDPIHFNNMDDLVEIERVKFPLNQWVLFNGYVLHGVLNVTGPRLNFNVSIKPDYFDFDIRPRWNNN